jgi:hypothetical protein
MTKQRKIILICIAIFIAWYFARVFSIAIMRMQVRHQIDLNKKPKPTPAETPAAAPAAPTEQPLENMAGVWGGRGQVPGRGLCDLRFEVKQNDPLHYTGYSRFSCMPTQTITNPKDANFINNMLNHINPDAAVLSGVTEKGSIHFHADKTIGTDINGCAVSDLTMTPFGKGVIAAEWQEGTCQGGQLLMTKGGQ